ncbi:hypothetical protein TNCV_468101 [Trichonephila clavipes]|nr:hypothetical protein TNCV_468101 [Trichonephila clavipes]
MQYSPYKLSNYRSDIEGYYTIHQVMFSEVLLDMKEVPYGLQLVGQVCPTLALLASSPRGSDMIVRRDGCQLRSHPGHLTMGQNFEVVTKSSRTDEQ